MSRRWKVRIIGFRINESSLYLDYKTCNCWCICCVYIYSYLYILHHNKICFKSFCFMQHNLSTCLITTLSLPKLMIIKINNYNYFVFLWQIVQIFWKIPLTETIDAYLDITTYLIRLSCSNLCLFKYFTKIHDNVIQSNDTIWLSKSLG